MMLRRSQFLPVVLGMLTALAANACSGSSGDDDDDSSSSGKGSVLGGSSGAGGDGGTTGGTMSGTTGGTGGTDFSTGGTSFAKGGKGGSSATGGTGTAGSDATGGDSGSTTGGSGGSTDTGGSGGTGGDGATGGGGTGGGGTGGSGGMPAGSGTMGDACGSDGDCESGLVCITADSTTLGGAAPPHGLCTLPCEDDGQCSDVDPGAYCVAFDVDATIRYCLQSCITGSDGIPKCNERPDFACSYLGLLDTTVTCETSDDCGDTQLCDEEYGVCADVITGCVPMCGGDFDCGSGQYCDFLSGMCTPGEESRDPIGSECDPSADTDPCAGFCSPLDDTGTVGACTGFCVFTSSLAGCGWEGVDTGAAQNACLYGTRLSPPDDVAPGDVGLCGSLCDCNDDCEASLQRCVDDSEGLVMEIYGRAGYCRPLLDSETESNSIACN